jgi:hypothetical protein
MQFQKMLEKMAPDSRSTLEECIMKRAQSVRFFSYGSNMNEGKFREDMGGEIGLVNRTTVVLTGFKRTLSNGSRRGIAFSISCSPEDKVEGICHDIPIEHLERFLKKEGVLKKDDPSYRIIKVTIPDQNEPILTLCGLKSKSIEQLGLEEAKKTLEYVKKSIKGAECCNINPLDMKKNKEELQKFIKTKRNPA